MLEFLSAVVSVIIFVWLFRGFMPVLRLRISSRCIDQESGRYVIGLEVENRSRISIRKNIARIQVLEYGSDIPKLLSEWVPFEKDRILNNESPDLWRDPVVVLDSTIKIEPGESIYVELLYTSSSETVAIHCAFQLQVKLNIIASIAYSFGYEVSDSWTTTAWIANSK